VLKRQMQGAFATL